MAAPLHQIGPVDPRGPHADQDFAVSRLGTRPRRQGQGFGGPFAALDMDRHHFSRLGLFIGSAL